MTISFLNDNKLIAATDNYTFNGKSIRNTNTNSDVETIGVFEPASTFGGFIKIPVPSLLKEFNPYWIINESGMALSINIIDKKQYYCIWKIN